MKSMNRIISLKWLVMWLAVGCMLWLAAGNVYAYEDDMYWDETEACWDDIDDADRYQVRLYRGDTLVTTKTVKNSWYDFEENMVKSGTYRFRVRERIDGEYGKWSSYSEAYEVGYSGSDGSFEEWLNKTLNMNFVSTTAGSKTTTSKTTTSKTSSQTASQTSNPMVIVLHEGWQQDGNGWWYRKADGSYPKDTWYQIGSSWYNFDSVGYMRTGWIQRNQSWFYCLPSGEMAVGGWQHINNVWYYFDENGYMLANTVTPDGYRVDASGAWIQ